MKCPRCQHDVPRGAKFCQQCGTPLAPTCQGCGAALSPSMRFCPACGHAVAEAVAGDAPRAVAAAHEGERKQVTVLFADLKGSMELIAQRDPEDARKLLDPVLALMMDAVHEYEGTVNQVMGDGIMALFGAPLAHEGHAVRACYAALRMQERVREYGQTLRAEHGAGIEIRIGINSGEVVVRSIGSDLRTDYTAVGQTTHLAARLEQLAEPGMILASAETMRLAETYVEAASLGRVAVKGLEHPVDVYSVTGAGPARTPIQAAAARGLTPFIGRQRELATLDHALAAAAAGQGRVVGIVGEPGVGKSRLLYEFTSSRTRHGWLVLQASAASYGKTTAYRPIVDLLRAYFGVEGKDDPRGVREIVQARVETLDPALLPAVPALAALVQPAEADPEWDTLDRRQRRQQTLDAVRRLLVRESVNRPTCVVLEDLHWIDSETHALLDSLIDALPAARLLLLLNYRPEFRHDWSARAVYTQLRVDALGPEHAHAVLRALVGGRAELAPLAELLVARTDGNPFFLEESVRTLMENGVLAGPRGDCRLARRVDGIDVPSTVQAVLAARIDRLAEDDKRLLQCAAVIGERVPASLLEAIADTPPDALRDGLARLLAGEFLYERRAFPEPEYVFRHGLTRQVAYNSLLHGRRRALHARIVSHIEARDADRLTEHVEQLATHAWRGELWDRAARYLRQAGVKAFAHSANREAVAWFEQALEVLARLPETAETQTEAIDVHLGLRNALTLLGEHERTLEHLRRAAAVAERLGDRARLGRAMSFEANALLLLARHDEAIAAGRRARAIAEERGDMALRTATDLYVGRAHLFRGEFPQAIAIFRAVVAALGGERAREHLGMPVLPAVFARSHLVECLVELGRLAESARCAEEAVTLAEARDHPDTLLWAYHGAGVHHLACGAAEAAIAAFQRAWDLCASHDMPAYRPRVGAELALALALAGRAAEAVPMARSAAEEAGARRQVASHSQVLLLLGEVCLCAETLDEAHAAATAALDRFRAQGERAHEAWALRVLGDVAARGGPGDAGTRYHAGRELGAALGMAPLVARCDAGLARAGGPG